ncbi:MAG: ssl1498 family light-harvesting-like protein [Symploca sp. SIO3C6]|nr:ssl1498 family light-harvesting-like protein [Symploca sp. SIO3C6]
MYTTQLDNGITNAYAAEPDMYYAIAPSPEQQRNYAQQNGLAVLLVATLLSIALTVS